jgi:hypothetical protein
VGSLRFAPYILPGIGWGRLGFRIGQTNLDFSDLRFMLGGGISVLLRNALSVDIAVQKVYLEGSESTFGAGLGWAF